MRVSPTFFSSAEPLTTAGGEPAASRVTVIVSTAGPFRIEDSLSRTFIAGPRFSPLHLDYPEQAGCYEWTLSIFEVQDILGIHPRDIINQVIDLSDLPNTETVRRMKDGLDIQTRDSETAEISRLAKFAWRQFSDYTQQSLKGLCDNAGVSNRRLEQVFKSTFGVSPKQVQSLLRFEYAVELMQTCKDSLSDIAASAGYSDQSHMTREVRRFSGLSPARLRALLKQIA